MKHPDLLAIEGIEALGEEACFHDAEVRRLELKDVALPSGGNVTLIFDGVEGGEFTCSRARVADGAQHL